MRCSCGEHNLGPGPYESCYFCGATTTSRPMVDWSTGRLFVPYCHACSGLDTYRYEDTYMPVDQAPPALVQRAHVLVDANGVVQFPLG